MPPTVLFLGVNLLKERLLLVVGNTYVRLHRHGHSCFLVVSLATCGQFSTPYPHSKILSMLGFGP